MMDFRERLRGRITLDDIYEICYLTQGDGNFGAKEALYLLVDDEDERVAYNALWVFAHFSLADNEWLYSKRDGLIDRLLACSHAGKCRLLLTLLERQPTTRDDLRVDYLDYCLSKINGAEPYATRALCMKQAYAQCRHFPELMSELAGTLGLLEDARLSPGFRSARRNILKRIAKP